MYIHIFIECCNYLKFMRIHVFRYAIFKGGMHTFK